MNADGTPDMNDVRAGTASVDPNTGDIMWNVTVSASSSGVTVKTASASWWPLAILAALAGLAMLSD